MRSVQWSFKTTPSTRRRSAWSSGIAASGIQKAAENGALLAGCSTGFVEETVRLAARVARGAPASTIPVERSTRFGYAINLRTARKLGITVPASLLVGADKLYE